MRNVRYRLVLWGEHKPVILEEEDGTPVFYWGSGVPVGNGKSIDELTLEDLPFRPAPGTNLSSLVVTPVGVIEHGDLLEMFRRAEADYLASQRESVAA